MYEILECRVWDDASSTHARSQRILTHALCMCRWDIDGHAELFETIPPRFSAHLPAVDLFDTAAFNMSGAEASLVDPQQRLLLECAAEIVISISIGSPADVGMFLGLSSTDYASLVAGSRPGVTAYTATSKDMITPHFDVLSPHSD